MTGSTRRLIAWLPALAWAAAIFAVSSFPGSRLPGHLPSELGHIGEYVVLGVLLYVALRRDLSPPRALAAAVVIASIFGVTDEIHQSFVPTRTPDIVDWGLDTFGALAGAACGLLVENRLAARRATRPHGAQDQ